MSAAAPICERLRAMPSSLNDACRTMEEAADEIDGLRKANHHYRDAVDVLESNARVQAKLLADTGRRVEELGEHTNCLEDTLGSVLGFLEGDPQYANARPGLIVEIEHALRADDGGERRDRINELEAALRQARARIDYLGLVCTNPRHFEENNKTFLPEIDAAINREPGK